MSDSYIAVGADGAGKKVQTYKNTVAGVEVHTEAFVIVDSSGVPVAIATEATLTSIDGNLVYCDTDNVTVVSSDGLKAADLSIEAISKHLEVDVKNGIAVTTDGLKASDLLIDGSKHLQVDVVTLPTITQSTKHDSKVYAPAVFDASASGNLVAAVADKVTKLHAITFQAQGTVIVNLNNGSGGSSLMEWSFQAREGAVVPMANAPAYWAITSVNTALYVTLSAAVQVTITAIISSDDAS